MEGLKKLENQSSEQKNAKRLRPDYNDSTVKKHLLRRVENESHQENLSKFIACDSYEE